MKTIDPHYENHKLAQLYDLSSGWSKDRAFYLSLTKSHRQTILDLGCGTGLLCDAFASNDHEVTGVDPSATMLEIARRKPHGNKVEWIQSTAQEYISEKRFDLIIMTGHAFQVLLEESDVQQTFAVMRKHLKSGGSVVFESRNPDIDWASTWDYKTKLQLPESVVLESRRFLKMENSRMTFEFSFQFHDEEIVTKSELRFWLRQEIENHIKASGLVVHKLLGDWGHKEFDRKSSEEMIFIVRSSS